MNRPDIDERESPRVALFVTCLADMFRPEIGFAAAKLLEQAGCKVDVPLQSCCGQPGYNGGDQTAATAIARNVIATFEPYPFVVAPSGSCAGMIRPLPRMLQDDEAGPSAPTRSQRRRTNVLVPGDVRGVTAVAAECRAGVAYHDSCPRCARWA